MLFSFSVIYRATLSRHLFGQFPQGVLGSPRIQQSGAEVISGSVRFRVGAEERSLKAGESITIPANTPHFFWNDGEEEAHFIGWFRPALKIERFFESFFGLAQDGKLNDK